MSEKEVPVNQNRIKQLRLERHKTQKEVGKAIGLSDRAIAHYEKGIREPKLETWIKLADFFNVPVSYLQGLSDHNYNDPVENARSFLNSHPNLADSSLDDANASEIFNFMDPSDLNNQMRDSAIRQFQQLVNLFLSKSDSKNWTEIREDQRKKMIKIVNSLDDKKIDEVVHYVSMAFYMLLDGDSNDKNSLKKAIDDFYLKYITDEGGFN